jgi:translation initiation factor 2B subunit (eIF-2B alpha/beta/delta family)
MDDKVRVEIAAIASDARSGATAILTRAVAVLRATARDPAHLRAAADALCRAQPSMAGVRAAAAIACGAADPVAALDEFAQRTARAPRLIARHAVSVLRLRRRRGPVRLVTCSRSHAVELAIRALAEQVTVEVSCAEARPGLEGRDLAASLAEAGLRLTVYTDAGIGAALQDADALLVGADAVGPDGFINKVGTAALAALASVEGVPTYVLAGREKCLAAEEFSRLAFVAGPASEVWPSAAPAVRLANPYFELVPSSLAVAFITDAGVVSSDDLPHLCRS